MFDHPIVTGAQLLRAIPGAAERTLRAAACINATSRVGVIFHGDSAACKIERSDGAMPKATKRNPNPAPVYTVKGMIQLPGVDSGASLPRSVANEWLAYSLHEVFHGIYTERESYNLMLRRVLTSAGAAKGLDMGGLHSIWNAIEDPRIENAAVQHGVARGYAAVARGLVLKHWREPEAAQSRAVAVALANQGRMQAAYRMLPGVVAYYGRLWLPQDDRDAMRAELPACILPTVDKICGMLAALSVRSLAEATHADAQARDVEPILRALLDAMRSAKAGASGKGDKPQPGKGEGSPEPGEAGEPGEGDEGEGEPQEGAQPGENAPQGADLPGEVPSPAEGDPEQGEAPEGEPGEGAGRQGEAEAGKIASDRPAGAKGGSNQAGDPDAAPDLSGSALNAEPMNKAPTAPVITAEVLTQVGADNPLSEYAQPKATKAPEALPMDTDAEVIRARNSVKNPGAIAFQLRRLLSKTDTSEHRRGLSHGRLRVQALPRALASGSGAFQRRMDSGSDRCSIVVACDTSSSMRMADGARGTMSRSESAGAFAMLLLDALRGAHGSNAFMFGFGGNMDRTEFNQMTFRPSLLKGWQDSYQTAIRRAAMLKDSPHGGTPIRPAIAYAVRELRNAPPGRKVLIVLTDADFDGRQERPLVEQAEREGVITIGVGIGANASQIGNLFPAHSIAVAEVAQLTEQVCRLLADAVLTSDHRR